MPASRIVYNYFCPQCHSGSKKKINTQLKAYYIYTHITPTLILVDIDVLCKTLHKYIYLFIYFIMRSYTEYKQKEKQTA